MFLLVLFAVFAGLVYWIYWNCVSKRQYMLDKLTTRAVFITGCDSGFGRALATRLDRKGVPVFAGCFTDRGVQELVQGGSTRMRATRLDVTSDESIQAAFEWVKHNLKGNGIKGLWGVVNNAGIAGPAMPVEFYTRECYRSVLNVNLMGVIETTRVFLPLIKRSEGRIVNMSSTVGITALPSIATHLCSKWALSGWSEALRREKASFGIKVSTVFPSLFATPMVTNLERHENMLRESFSNADKQVQEEYGGQGFIDQYVETNISGFRHMIKNERAESDISPVVDAYEHALFARYPRDQYIIGKEAKLGRILELLPSAAMDFFINQYYQHPTTASQD